MLPQALSGVLEIFLRNFFANLEEQFKREGKRPQEEFWHAKLSKKYFSERYNRKAKKRRLPGFSTDT
jgi:hypothetical protein